MGVENSGDIRDKVEKELEPDTIVKMQSASRKRYEEFNNKAMENEKKINKVSGNIWYSVFPITKRGILDIQEDDSETYFTVTSLGKIELRTSSNSRL